MTDEAAPWSDERIDRMIAREREFADVLAAVGEALKTVPIESRERVIRAVAVLYDVDLTSHGGRL